MAEIHDES